MLPRFLLIELDHELDPDERLVLEPVAEAPLDAFVRGEEP